MRHGHKFNPLGRKRGHRKALMKNLTIALFTHKRINTTLAKAKALRVHAEPLITKAKDNTTHSRRTVFSYIQNKEAIKELFEVIAPKIADRPGGYLRVIKTGTRKGDGAETALIEFVDFNETYKVGGQQESDTSGGRRRRRKKGGSSDTKASAGAAAASGAAIAAASSAEEEE
jgi:large subunit ribosomal protein L17